MNYFINSTLKCKMNNIRFGDRLAIFRLHPNELDLTEDLTDGPKLIHTSFNVSNKEHVMFLD